VCLCVRSAFPLRLGETSSALQGSYGGQQLTASCLISITQQDGLPSRPMSEERGEDNLCDGTHNAGEKERQKGRERKIQKKKLQEKCKEAA
jgi:hypothetical protein